MKFIPNVRQNTSKKTDVKIDKSIDAKLVACDICQFRKDCVRKVKLMKNAMIGSNTRLCTMWLADNVARNIPKVICVCRRIQFQKNNESNVDENDMNLIELLNNHKKA